MRHKYHKTNLFEVAVFNKHSLNIINLHLAY